MTQNYIAPLVDKDKNNLFPETVAKAIIDGDENFVNLSGDQLSISGAKNFTGSVTVQGQSVMTKLPDIIPGFIPTVIDDIFTINKSGNYFYNIGAKNKPSTATGLYNNGYIIGIFKDENNGALQFLGTGVFIEKYNGKWQNYVYPKA